MRVALFLILLGLAAALALVASRPRLVPPDLTVTVIGQTNLASGRSVTLLQLSNACNSEIQTASQILEVRTKGSTNVRQGRLSGSALYLQPSQAKSLMFLPQAKGKEWRLTVQYYTKGSKQVKDKLFQWGFPGRTLRRTLINSVTTEWTSDS